MRGCATPGQDSNNTEGNQAAFIISNKITGGKTLPHSSYLTRGKQDQIMPLTHKQKENLRDAIVNVTG